MKDKTKKGNSGNATKHYAVIDTKKVSPSILAATKHKSLAEKLSNHQHMALVTVNNHMRKQTGALS